MIVTANRTEYSIRDILRHIISHQQPRLGIRQSVNHLPYFKLPLIQDARPILYRTVKRNLPLSSRHKPRCRRRIRHHKRQENTIRNRHNTKDNKEQFPRRNMRLDRPDPIRYQPGRQHSQPHSPETTAPSAILLGCSESCRTSP